MDDGSGFAARGGWWVAGQFVLFVAFAAALLWAPAGTVPAAVALIGWVLALAGGVLIGDGIYRIRAHLTAYPAPLEHGKLVEHGSYRLARHPIYGGLAIAAFGLSLAAGNWVALLVAVVLGAFFYAKAGFEERLLVATYPDYVEYERRVPRRLIPWLL